MRLLVLGGTSFVGRHVVEVALKRGHEVTLFNRGQSAPELFPGLDRRTGDRATGDYSALAGGHWDGTVDVSAYVPRHVQQVAAALGGDAGRYVFISTGSVYSDPAMDVMTEDAPQHAPERGTEEVTGETYGPLKVACEQDALAAYGERATIVRPGIVAGPYDPTDRFTYWVRRIARGGEVVVPARLDQPVQVVDARDLGEFVVHALENDTAGTYNAVGPGVPLTFAGMFEALRSVAGSDAAMVPSDRLGEDDLPLVVPPDGSWDGFFRRSSERARAAGFVHRPIEATAADVLAWDRERGEPPLGTGPDDDAHARMLAAARA